MKTFVFATDNHGDLVNRPAAQELFAFCEKFKPDIRISGGDCFDIRSLRAGATNHEEGESLKDDIEMGKWFIRNFKPTHALHGNHEDRLFNAMHNSGSAIVRDYAEGIINEIENEYRANGCSQILPFDVDKGVLELGPIRAIHGYAHSARAIHEQGMYYCPVGGALLCGDAHVMEMTTIKRHGGGVSFCGGCLMDISKAHYAKRRLTRSRWANGWLYGFYDPNDHRTWKVWQAHKVGSTWCYTTETSITHEKLL